MRLLEQAGQIYAICLGLFIHKLQLQFLIDPTFFEDAKRIHIRLYIINHLH